MRTLPKLDPATEQPVKVKVASTFEGEIITAEVDGIASRVYDCAIAITPVVRLRYVNTRFVIDNTGGEATEQPVHEVVVEYPNELYTITAPVNGKRLTGLTEMSARRARAALQAVAKFATERGLDFGTPDTQWPEEHKAALKEFLYDYLTR